MNYAQLKEEIIAYSKTIGIDKIGFTTADYFTVLKQRLIVAEQNGYLSGFEEKDVEKRANPKLLLHEAQSIIAIAVAYPSKLREAPTSKKGAYRGIFCRASWGRDYHHVLRDRLAKLEAFIQERVPEARMRSMVDTGELSDRAVAERAGIGWSAKNSAIITPEFGSYVYLGEMITNIPFEPDTPIEDRCGSCTKCIDVCPTDALVQGGQLNAQRCIAFLTQTKDFLADEFRDKIGNRLYGCDTCQTVCPENRGKDFHYHLELEPDVELVKPLLKPLLTMSNKEFKEKYGPMSGSWRGKKPIQRNAILALAHFKDVSALEELRLIAEKDERPVIKGTAYWAIAKIGGTAERDYLQARLLREQDEAVCAEIEKGLTQFT